MRTVFFRESRIFFQNRVELPKKLSITFDFAMGNRSPSVEWWNWQTRMIKGHVP